MELEVDSEAWLARERELVLRARKGERDAVAALYRAFAGRIYSRVLMPRLGNAQAAEDALSETFRTALERLEQFDDRGMSIYFWLSRIAVNKATDMHRVKQRTRRALTSFEDLIAPIRPSAPRPERVFEDAERAELLREHVGTVLGSINPRYRRAIELRFIEDKTREDCAKEMEVKLGTYDVLLLRALRSFRKEWEKLTGGALGSEGERMNEEDHDEDEQREADALARALDRGSATDDLPEEALQTAALIRYSSDGGALSSDREDVLLNDVLTAGERAAKQREGRTERAPSPWWRWIAAFAGVSAIAVVIVIVFAGRLATVEPTTLPSPGPSLLSAQIERIEGEDDARFETEMRAYRSDVYEALGERYGTE